MIKKEEFQFQSADGVSKIHGVEWTPENGEIVAALQITHGMVEYIERYEGFAEYLCQMGFVVFGHDHIGHGESVANEEEWGIMRGEHPSDIMVEDMYQDYMMHKQKYQDIPYFMLGHSMGSYMLRKYLTVHAKDMEGVNGAIIMGTGTESALTINVALALINIIAKFKSWNYRSTFVQGLTYGGPYKVYDVTGENPENSWLSKNVENVKKYYKDPKCTYVFSLSGYQGLIESTKFDNDQKNINKISKTLPILFTSGEDDPVGNMGKGVRTAFDKFKQAGIRDLSIKLYVGDRHEILNETDRTKVYQDLFYWMKDRM